MWVYGVATLHKTVGLLSSISNGLLSVCAGVSAFVFTLLGYLLLSDLNQQLVASMFIGLFALLVVWVASEKPNSGQARAVASLVNRLLAVETGDLASPAPAVLREEMPALASAIEGLFTQVRSNIDNVHAMAMYDPVTSLPNRLHFKREADRTLNARRGEDLLALLFVDLDGFKQVNDSLGHAQGDHTLALVAGRLREIVKQEVQAGTLVHPLIARLAGDEFTLLFPAVASIDEAMRIARRLLAALCEDFHAEDQRVRLGASIGVALCPEHGRELTSLMKAADIAMYHAKASGRSQVCLYNEELAAKFEGKARIERALQLGVAQAEFELAFVPRLSARTGSVVAAEALVRWNHPTDGVLLPDRFMPIAEESRVVAEIGDWVADQAALALARWQCLQMPQQLAVKISSRQLERYDFFGRLRASLAGAGASAAMLELEFSETLAMRCSDNVVREMAMLREDGATITIDRFGSGYSNLARMKDMPIDRVKLDASLTDEIDSSDSARTIVSSVIHLIHGLGAQVVCEGIDRHEQFEVLRALGCDLAQGAVFGAPMTEREFIAWVSSQNEGPRAARIA